jgi:hypothetical protein
MCNKAGGAVLSHKPSSPVVPATTMGGIRAMTGGMNTLYRIADRDTEAARWAINAPWQVREDGDFYIPDFIGADFCNSRPKVYAAADDHARDLRRAEQQLDDVLNLARVLRASVQEEDDSRAMQADTVLKIIEKKLNKAHNSINRHDARHLNLFMAYFDLKERSGRTTDDHE